MAQIHFSTTDPEYRLKTELYQTTDVQQFGMAMAALNINIKRLINVNDMYTYT